MRIRCPAQRNSTPSPRNASIESCNPCSRATAATRLSEPVALLVPALLRTIKAPQYRIAFGLGDTGAGVADLDPETTIGAERADPDPPPLAEQINRGPPVDEPEQDRGRRQEQPQKKQAEPEARRARQVTLAAPTARVAMRLSVSAILSSTPSAVPWQGPAARSICSAANF
jgi:hypothetical protein